MSDHQETIDLLKKDMRDEHAAIIQYLQHAYAVGEGEEACEIEAIARDEMRHFDWLAETIVELGGKPDMERSFVDLEGSGPGEWMGHDVQAEERAIAQYKAHIAAIGDPKIKRLLRRILNDEEAHRNEFAKLSGKLATAEAAAPLGERTGAGAPPRVLEILQTGVQHEYSVILQYLYHNFVMPNCEVSRELEMQAINEMQHMGWLSEEVAGMGGHPLMEHTELALEGTPEEMLKTDIAAEQAVTLDYTRQIGEIEDEDLRGLITRIREHEVYHIELFGDLLDEVKETPEGPSAPNLTVGSLMDE